MNVLYNINNIIKNKNTINNIINNITHNMPIDISGPIIIRYYKSLKYNKKIILLGDRHRNRSGSCIKEPILTIKDYIASFANKNIQIDLFIETDIPHKLTLKSGSVDIYKYTTDHLTDVVNWGQTMYKKIDNIRIHFADVRGDANNESLATSQAEYRNTEKFINFLYDVRSLKTNINLMDVFHDFTNFYNSNLMIFLSYLVNRPIRPDYKLYPTLEKELTKLKLYDESMYEKLTNITKKYIAQYMKYIMDDNLFITLDNIDTLKNIYNTGIYATVSIADLYIIARIMKNSEYKNNVIYVGAGHLHDMDEYLNAMDFEFIHEIKADDKTFRCIKNIIPFDVFFNQ